MTETAIIKDPDTGATVEVDFTEEEMEAIASGDDEVIDLVEKKIEQAKKRFIQ